MIPFVSPPAPKGEWAYFLDVDGTLIDIAETPNAVQVDQMLVYLIEQLHRATGGAVALITGRALSDLQCILGPLNLPMAGLHGLERRDSSGRLWIHAAPPPAKHSIMEALEPVLERYPDLLLEDKGLALALHYRRAPHLAFYVKRLMKGLAGGADANLTVQSGKSVVEIKPAGFDKGTAVAEYLTESPFKGRCPVFIGDDLTDEHGFALVNRLDGVSIKVGKGPSCANFRLPDVAAVRLWLGNALKGKE